MTAKAVWVAGLSALAVLGAVGLYRVLPVMEGDLQASVDHALTVGGFKDLRASVSGQTVTLSTSSDTPEARAELKRAQAILADVKMNEPVLPGGKLVNSPISDIQLASAQKITPPVTPDNDHSALPGNAPKAPEAAGTALEIIHGDRATAVASTGDLPRVAGDAALEASAQAARSCDQELEASVGQRQVVFKTGTYEMTSESQGLIDEIYKVVAACPVQVRLTVSGYTDNLGDGMVNQTISQARAQAAADALVRRGLTPGRVTVRGYGGALPVADNATPEGRAKNRRIVFTVNAG